MRNQYSLSVNSHTTVVFGNEPLIQQFDSLQRFIRYNFSPGFHSLFLKPVKRRDIIEYHSEGNQTLFPLQDLGKEDQQRLLQQYNALLHLAEDFRRQLNSQTDPDKYHWSELLQKAFHPSNHLLFSDGNVLGIVWGWQFNLEQNHLLPLEDYAHLLPASVPDEVSPEAVEPDLAQNGAQDSVSQESMPEVNQEPDAIPGEENIPETDQKEEQQTAHVYEPQPPTPDPPKPSRRKRIFIPFSNGFTRFLDACEQFAHRYPWLMWLLLLLLLAGLFFLYKKWDGQPTGDARENAEFREISPPQPRVRKRPVRREDRIRDEETGSEVVGNVVNIALKKKEDDFQRFVVELKNAFPDSTYEVLYYDDETRRIQFGFPMTERASIKQGIKEKMNAYDLLIWDEAIFSNSRTFNDPSFADPEKSGPWKLADLPAAWDLSTGDTSVIVAVIDDGFDLNHEEFRGRIVKPYNVISHNSQVVANPQHQFHGTHVAGIVGAAGNNGKGMSGVAPGCRIMPIQASADGGSFMMTDVVDGILYAIKNNADVINLSLGMAFGQEVVQLSPEQQAELAARIGVDAAQFWDELFEMAERNKVTIVAAAGNQNVIVGLDPLSRSSRIIRVAASDPRKQKAEFSNYFKSLPADGSCVCAPGVKIYSTFPGGKYQFLDGTSMAAPMVSGVAALIRSKKPGISNRDLMKILYETGLQTGNPKLGPLIQAGKAVGKTGF
jgi:subtilisin family serine protease